MKSLPILLRIARRDLDVLRRGLAAEIAKGIALAERLKTHEQSVKDEQKVALKDYEGTRAYGGFAGFAVASRLALEAEAEAIEANAAQLRALITEAHVEMRKFERLLELQTERERIARNKRDDAELDELTTLRAGRAKP